MQKTRLRKYAQLIAKAGVNVQKGQEVFILAGLDQPEFVKMVVEECYKLGASRVEVDFDYQPLEKLHVRYCSLKVLGTGRPEGHQPEQDAESPADALPADQRLPGSA